MSLASWEKEGTTEGSMVRKAIKGVADMCLDVSLLFPSSFFLSVFFLSGLVPMLFVDSQNATTKEKKKGTRRHPETHEL